MSLLDRLRAATGPDRELDWLVCNAICPWTSDHDWQPFGYVDVDGQQPHPDQVSYVKDGRWFYMDLPRYTASVDACLALVGEKLPGREGELLRAAQRHVDFREWGPNDSYVEQLALALLTALVAAMGEGLASGTNQSPGGEKSQ